MSRTKRIYNSYKKYGRFYPKHGYGSWKFINEISYQIPLQSFNLNDEKNGIGNKEYILRYHPYKTFCMGNCRYCKEYRGFFKWKESKQNRKRKIIKFDF